MKRYFIATVSNDLTGEVKDFFLTRAHDDTIESTLEEARCKAEMPDGAVVLHEIDAPPIRTWRLENYCPPKMAEFGDPDEMRLRRLLEGSGLA